MNKKENGENIWNVPNTLTFVRLVVTFLTIYLVIIGADVRGVVVLFAFGMFTDFLDGFIARKFNQTTEFGRKFDMIADRFLFVGVSLTVLGNLAYTGLLDRYHLVQFFIIASREMIALPVALLGFIAGKKIPKVRNVGKATTCLQAFAFPSILLSVYYEFFSFSIYLALVTCFVGLYSAFKYIQDVLKS